MRARHDSICGLIPLLVGIRLDHSSWMPHDDASKKLVWPKLWFGVRSLDIQVYATVESGPLENSPSDSKIETCF